MSDPIRFPCHLCGQPVVVEQWAFVWGRAICHECQDYDPGEPGMFEQDHDDTEE